MKVAAFQASMLPPGASGLLELIRRQIERCEAEAIAILCCPEAIIGGLADYAENPTDFAIPAESLGEAFAPLASETVTTIIGFTELGDCGRLYNSAAVCHRGSVLGVYRKRHPAINQSIYEAGAAVPVFQIEGLTFGIVICYDSTFPELARSMADQGATTLFVPTNNGLPTKRASAELVTQARACDVAAATENGMWVVRADVAGRTNKLTSYGSSGIVSPDGNVMQSARQMHEDLIVTEIDSRRH